MTLTGPPDGRRVDSCGAVFTTIIANDTNVSYFTNYIGYCYSPRYGHVLFRERVFPVQRSLTKSTVYIIKRVTVNN